MSIKKGTQYLCDRCGHTEFSEERFSRVMTEPGERPKDIPTYTPTLPEWAIHTGPLFGRPEGSVITLCPSCARTFREQGRAFMHLGVVERDPVFEAMRVVHKACREQKRCFDCAYQQYCLTEPPADWRMPE